MILGVGLSRPGASLTLSGLGEPGRCEGQQWNPSNKVCSWAGEEMVLFLSSFLGPDN